MANALIVIDLQLDFCPGGALPVPDGDAIVGTVNAEMNKHDVVVLTQDWHPADHSSFADNHSGREPYEVMQMAYGPQVLWPRHCVQGSEGARLHPGLMLDRADLILRKGGNLAVDSYSAFFENDHKTSTGLAGYLRDRNVDTLTFVGLAFDFCVSWSALDAVKLGFTASVLEDASFALDLRGSASAARRNMSIAGVTFK